ncbi:N-acetylglucosamine-1-phosphodiester alpha-N-acetylglucosaminidase [Trichoplax sp. H2]|nr:N-acetylglucosamine-1-phosphodiester alpha-N-acetylglucosaminidase [Trichoplax sp. H2]|eukprot:RDD47125.1 N-acetylglucosamine-1-phosphodiester alpha-N-acetylglucosaminidase [Trichoplax sp. H2]
MEIIRLLFYLIFLLHAIDHALCSDSTGHWYQDILRPYQKGHHGPTHSHHVIRSLQNKSSFGHDIFESTRTETNLAKPQIKVHEFIDDFYSFFFFENVHIYGRLTVVEDPLRTISVLEPQNTGGCNMSKLSTVADTARKAHCYVAENAGFFNTETGGCYGNIISNGRLVRLTNVQNVNFGIRKNGSIIVGYLTEEEILDKENPFVQLVSGVIWLVRNGKSYVKESMKMESNKHEETGTLKQFIEVKSARTAIGHDRNGNVMLMQIEGQTNARGLNLYDFAKKLIKSGFVNAINLDGGGSSTTAIDGIAVGYPSDHCASNPAFRCARPVSTVICAHHLYCLPQDCNNHGKCVNGKCLCNDKWIGEACDTVNCKHLHNCSGNGVCTLDILNINLKFVLPYLDGCNCNPGWTGLYCEQACPHMSFGLGCNQTCKCQNGAKCDPITGDCSCVQGWTGSICDRECPLGFYGRLCVNKCSCDLPCMCNPVTGECIKQSERCNRLEIQCHTVTGMLQCSVWKLGFFALLGAFIASILSVLYLFLLIKRQPRTKSLRRFKINRTDSEDEDESFLMAQKSHPDNTDDERKSF